MRRGTENGRYRGYYDCGIEAEARVNPCNQRIRHRLWQRDGSYSDAGKEVLAGVSPAVLNKKFHFARGE